MTYICVTYPSDLDIMNGFSGTTLIHTEETFLVWLWTDPGQENLQSKQWIAVTSIHIPL